MIYPPNFEGLSLIFSIMFFLKVHWLAYLSFSCPQVFTVVFTGFSFFIFCLFQAIPMAYGGSQARGLIRAVATGLHHTHSNTNLRCICDLPHSSWKPQILNPLSKATDQTCHPHGSQLDLFPLHHDEKSVFLQIFKKIPVPFLHLEYESIIFLAAPTTCRTSWARN